MRSCVGNRWGGVGLDRTIDPVAHDPRILPDDLPVPVDDGAAAHLLGAVVPSVPLPATTGTAIDLAEVESRWTVLFAYPRTGVPGTAPLPGWDAIPGARGCTPQSCGYRDLAADLASLGAAVFGTSTQTTDEQLEFAEREHIPFALLSDHHLDLARALALPTFTAGGLVLHRRITLVIADGVVAHVRYPVFPPDQDAAATLAWLRSQG